MESRFLRERYGPWQGGFLKLSVEIAPGRTPGQYPEDTGGLDWDWIWGRPDPLGWWGWDSFNNRLQPWGQQTLDQWSGLPGGMGTNMGQNVDPGAGSPIGYTRNGDPIYSVTGTLPNGLERVVAREVTKDDNLVEVGFGTYGRTLYVDPATGQYILDTGPGTAPADTGTTQPPPVDTSGTQVTPGGEGVKPGDLGTIASTTVTGIGDINTQPVDITGSVSPTGNNWDFMWPGNYIYPGLTIGDQTPIFRTDVTPNNWDFMWPGRYVWPTEPNWESISTGEKKEEKKKEEKKEETKEETTETGGGGGGGVKKPDEKKPATRPQIPILPIPAGQGAPMPGGFAPVVGPQGMQTIFGGPYQPQPMVPFLNQLLAGGF